MIDAKGIVKSFGKLQVLKGIDFHAGESEVISIMGASGAGKSTLLQILGTLSTPDAGSLKIDGTEGWTRLTGRHNAYNILAIYTTAVTLGASPEEVLVAVSRLEPAPGRLETMRGPQDRTVVIDYAHTPDALENVLTTLRDIAPDRELICLFGCGGDRDRTKRPEMAQVAQRLADRIIVTSDNSRTERTEDIMEDIKAGMDTKGRAKSLFISDRKEAIRTAIMLSGPGATVLLAGKGHETYQIIGTEKHHFDEREIVTDIFKDMLKSMDVNAKQMEESAENLRSELSVVNMSLFQRKDKSEKIKEHSGEA